MYASLKRPAFLLSLLSLTLLSSCATLPKHPPASKLCAYTFKTKETIFERYLPVFVIENYNEKHNLIGTPSARIKANMKEEIFVNHEISCVYVQKRRFRTSKGSYTNLIYRVHFEKIPFGLIPFSLGSGKNIGLIVVATLNKQGEPILYTTVHTCGCYLAFVPTSYMPAGAFPEDWEKKRQTVHSENLPGLLDFKGVSFDQTRVMILIRDGSHRVKDIWLSDGNSFSGYNTVTPELRPLQSLERLPLKNGETISFYETLGPRKGYVRGSHKPWERILISWWAFDWRVGEDKKFGQDRDDGPLFYTSLKPWARQESDMRDFASFLRYWKWRL